VELRLWVLTIAMPREKATDDLIANLAASANSLPQVVGTLDQVRELVDKLTVAGILQRSREFRLTAAAGQTAQLLSGANEPQITSTTMTARGGGGRTNSFQYQPVGMNIQATPTFDAAGNLQVHLNFTASSIEKTDPLVVISESDDGKTLAINRTISLTVQTIARLKRDTAVLVQSDSIYEPEAGNSSRTQLLILGGKVLPPLE
jgi:hypothetical protein